MATESAELISLRSTEANLKEHVEKRKARHEAATGEEKEAHRKELSQEAGRLSEVQARISALTKPSKN